jgi:hypothetical protein
VISRRISSCDSIQIRLKGLIFIVSSISYSFILLHAELILSVGWNAAQLRRSLN